RKVDGSLSRRLRKSRRSHRPGLPPGNHRRLVGTNDEWGMWNGEWGVWNAECGVIAGGSCSTFYCLLPAAYRLLTTRHPRADGLPSLQIHSAHAAFSGQLWVLVSSERDDNTGTPRAPTWAL